MTHIFPNYISNRRKKLSSTPFHMPHFHYILSCSNINDIRAFMTWKLHPSSHPYYTTNSSLSLCTVHQHFLQPLTKPTANNNLDLIIILHQSIHILQLHCAFLQPQVKEFITTFQHSESQHDTRELYYGRGPLYPSRTTYRNKQSQQRKLP